MNARQEARVKRLVEIAQELLELAVELREEARRSERIEPHDVPPIPLEDAIDGAEVTR